MRSKLREQVSSYKGPCSVQVPLDQWRGFHQHSPAWWPRKFTAPTRDLISRVDSGLRKQLGR
jgi:hypothetical protein